MIGFGKKKKVISFSDENYDKSFKIPTIKKGFEDEIMKKTYEKEEFESTPHGFKIPNKIKEPTSKGLTDVKTAYDAYRDEKMISDEEKIKKHGTKYHEFDLLTNKSRKDYFGKEALVVEETDKNNVIEKKLIIPFNLESKVLKPLTSLYTQENIKTQEKIDFEEEIKNPVLEDEEPSMDLNDLVENDTFYYEEEIVIQPVRKETEKKLNFETDKKAISEEKAEKPLKSSLPLKSSYDDYEFPPFSLLVKKEAETNVSSPWIEEAIEIIDNTLKEFEIIGHVVNFCKGPTVTRYEIKVDAGVNVKRITNIEDNLKMRLSAKSLRIQAPIPGKPNVGLEVPNAKADMVFFGNICDSDEFKYSKSALKIAMGLDIDGNNIYLDIADMPHALVAGSTGSGKSVCINTLLISLLLRNRPSDLKLMLIDPKIVELIAYSDLPHLVTPVINDAKVASVGLKWAVEEMDRRYQLFAELRCKKISEYNEKIIGMSQYQKMPFILIVIDELADLMMVASQEVEDSIQRITQKARAAGIHLIVATQRPTTDVIKGTIKANIPSRISFKVASYTDSMTILDQVGAENLLGRGDMLIKFSDYMTRVQGAYVSEKEIENVTDFIRERNEPEYLFRHEDLKNKVAQISSDDEILYDVAEYAINNQSVSINGIQKAFNIGFNRAQKLIEMLEDKGIISGPKGAKGREVLISIDQLAEMFGEK